MANELAVRYEVDGSEITLNPGIVMRYMIDDASMRDMPESELAKVIMTCQARRLNPFTGDVVVQPRRDKRSGKPSCSLVVTKDFFIRRATANPAYKGMEAGISVLSRDGRPVKRKGSAVYKALGERLLGGWCEVEVDGWEKPAYAEVSLEEYDTGYSIWKTKPATMIRKVAVSQALREAFPNDFGQLYEPEEMGLETSKEAADIAPEAVQDAPQQREVSYSYYGNEDDTAANFDPETGEIYEQNVVEMGAF